MNENSQSNAGIKNIFETIRVATVTEDGLDAFKAIIKDNQAVKEFFQDKKSAYTFLDALYNTDKDLFTQTLATDNLLWSNTIHSKEEAQFFIEKINQLTNKQIQQIFDAKNAAAILSLYNNSLWVKDKRAAIAAPAPSP